MRAWAWCWPLLLWQPGCTVKAVTQDDTRPANFCQRDDQCGSGTYCRDGLCQAVNAELESLLLEVTPRSDSSLPHLTFVAGVTEVPTGGGAKDFEISGISTLAGSLQLPKSATCYPTFVNDDPNHPLFKAPDGVSLPVEVTLSLHQRLLGLSQQIYYAKTADDPIKGRYTFSLQVPAGEYDVYLVPPRGQTGCPVPPQLFRSRSIDSGTLDVPFLVSAVSKLELSIHWPKASPSLKGWTADIIEALGGNPISTEVVLGDPSDPGELSTAYEYAIELNYSPAVEAETDSSLPSSANDLFRLRPPDNVVAPTIFLDRTALGLFAGSSVQLSTFTHLPDAVTVEGQLARLDTGAPTRGSVSLVSTEIDGIDAGIFGSYRTTTEVGDDGLFVVQLPPGKYRVQAVPPVAAGLSPTEVALSSIEVSWDVPPDIDKQAGKLIELPLLAEIRGQAQVQGSQVQATPSPELVLPFEDAFGARPFLPRPSSTEVDGNGRFVLQADPGLYDVSVSAAEELGFARYVRSAVLVDQGDLDLGQLALPPPSVLSGTAWLVSAGVRAPMALSSIRAYAYLDKDRAYTRDAKRAVSVIEVGGTRTADDGGFRLLLPSSITTPN